MSNVDSLKMNDTHSEIIEESATNFVCEQSPYEEAIKLKNEGNHSFSKSDFQSAKHIYMKSLRMCKKLKTTEATELQKNLYLNLSLTLICLNEYTNAIQTANYALRIEPNNLKAIYRRGLARHNTGQLTEAKDDFTHIIQIDPNNQKAREQLTAVKLKLQATKKKTLGGLFDKNMGLYNDKPDAQDEAEKRKKEEEEYHKEWLEYVQENEGDKEATTTLTEFIEMKKKQKANNNNVCSPQDTSPASSMRSNNSTPRASHKSDTHSDLDEEDQKIMEETKKMGYCYFHKELTDEEKRHKAQFKPQLISSSSNTHFNNSQNAPFQPTSSQPAISSWNSAGTTYEEKDLSTWAKEHFKNLLISTQKSDIPNPSQKTMSDTTHTHTWKAEVVDVENITAEAYHSVVRGTRRFFFELSCKVSVKFQTNYTHNNEDKPEKSFKATYHLNDVSNIYKNDENWLADSHHTISECNDEHITTAKTLAKNFKDDLNSVITNFSNDFKSKS